MKKFLFVAVLILLVCQNTLLQADELPKVGKKKDFLQLLDKNADGKVSQEEFFTAMEKKFQHMDIDKSEAISVQELKLYGEKNAEARQKAQQAAKDDTSDKLYTEEAFSKLFIARAEKDFSVLDKNRDQMLTADELNAASTKTVRKGTKNTPVAEKKLSRPEYIAFFTAKAKRYFFKLDKNYDGVLSKAELAAMDAESKPGASLAKPKASASSPVSGEQQKQALIKSFFVGIDSNNDGKISQEEKTASIEKLFNRLDSNHDQFITPDEIIAGQRSPSINPL